MALKLLVQTVKKLGVDNTLEYLSLYNKNKEDTIKKARRLFDKLAGDEKELLQRISIYWYPVGLQGVKAMFPENTSSNAIEKLVDKSLLETDNRGSYWLHPLIREFAYDELKSKIEAHTLACDYYMSLAKSENIPIEEKMQSLIYASDHAIVSGKNALATEIISDIFDLVDSILPKLRSND
jgi:hypothetical protein